MSNSKFIKLTTKYSCLFLLISSFSFSASGCGRKVTKIDTSIKEAYDYDQEKLITAAKSECDIDWTGRGKLHE